MLQSDQLAVDRSESFEGEVTKRRLVRQPSTDVKEEEERVVEGEEEGQRKGTSEEKKERLTERIFKEALGDALDDAVRVATAKQKSTDSDAVIDRATLDRVKQLASGHLNELPSPRSPRSPHAASLSPRQPRDRFMAIATHSPRSPGATAQVSIAIMTPLKL